MAIFKERWEERASDYIAVRNNLVRDYGYGLDSSVVNEYEERASNALSRAKRKRGWKHRRPPDGGRSGGLNGARASG